MKKIITLLCIVTASLSFGQVLDEQFNSNAGFTTSTPFFSDGFSDYFGLAVVDDYNGDSTPNNLKVYTGFSGGFLAGMDLDGEGAALPITVNWTGLDITGLSSLEFNGEFAEFFDNPGDIDAADFILVEYQIDGGGFQNLIAFEGADFTSGTSNGNFKEDTNFDGTGDGALLTGAAQSFTKSIAGSGALIDLRMTISLNSGDEDFAVDSFVITGTNASGTPPVITCSPDFDADNDNGLCSAVVFFTDAIATDVDGDLDTVVQTMGLPSGSIFPNGINTIEFTATDLAGNTSTCQFIITVNDAEDPVAVCQSFTVVLNALGNGFLVPTNLDGGSTDNCAIDSLTVSQDAFSCADIGEVTIALTVFDAAGNSDTCDAIVTVVDDIAPVITCLGGSAGPSVFINEIHYDNAGADEDEAVEIAGPAGTDLSNWSLVFYNGNTGQEYNTVTLSGVIDDEGNGFGALNFPVSGIQNGSPDGIALANNSIVKEFISYEGSFTAVDGIASGMTSADIGVSEPNSTPTGMSLQLTGTGSASADFVWNSPEVSSPGLINAGQTFVAPTTNPLELSLDTDGMVSVPATDLVMSIDEACAYTVTVTGGGATLDLDCSNLGENIVEVFVTDNAGNISSCMATVNIVDDIAPLIVCENITIELGEDGTATLEAIDFLSEATDACGIDVLTATLEDVSCTDIGTPIAVTVFASDASGNISSCVANVIVVDLLAPELVCPPNVTVELDPDGTHTLVDYIASGETTAIDNCTNPVTIFTQDPAAGTTLSFGIHAITITAEDEYGNVATCSFDLDLPLLGVEDNELSNAIALYPNPANEQVILSNSTNVLLEKAMIYDINGKLISQINLQDMQTEKAINTSIFARGIYLVHIISDKASVVKQLIKE